MLAEEITDIRERLVAVTEQENVLHEACLGVQTTLEFLVMPTVSIRSRMPKHETEIVLGSF